MKNILIAITLLLSFTTFGQAPDPAKVKQTVYVKVPSRIDSILMASKHYVNTNFLDSQSTNYNNTRILSYKNGVVVDSTGVIAGVQSLNGQSGNVTIRQKYNSDSTYSILEVNGVDTDSLWLIRDSLTASPDSTIRIVTTGRNHVISATGGSGDSNWDTTGNNIINNNSGDIIFKTILPPSAVNAVVNPASGNLTGNYNYTVTFYNNTGETAAGGISTTISTSGQQADLIFPISTDTSVIGRKIYRNPASANDVVLMQLVTTIADNTTTTYTDNIADGALGVTVPRISTTGGNIYIDTNRVFVAEASATAFGFQAMPASKGYANTALGGWSMAHNTTGYRNVGTGLYSLFSNTTGYNNTATGVHSLNYNLTGHNNSAFGYGALINSTGSYNTATGSGALWINTTGNGNTATGYSSLYHNTTGGNAAAFGSEALFKNETGYGSVAFGFQTLYENVSGNFCTAVGMQAMKNSNVNSSSAFGFSSAFNSVYGYYNTSIGNNTLYSNVNGYGNVALGHEAGYYETGNNKLHINNSGVGDLLYGDFASGQLQINAASTPALTASAALDVISTTKGILAPRLTTTQMNAISSPASGLFVTNTDSLNRLFIYTGAGWKGLSFNSEVASRISDSLTAQEAKLEYPLLMVLKAVSGAPTDSLKIAQSWKDSAMAGTNILPLANTFTNVNTFQGIAASDGGVQGTEQFSASGWTAADWTGDWAAGFDHTTGNTTVLSNTFAAVVNYTYLITYTVSGWTAGTFSITFGGVTFSGLSATGSKGMLGLTTGNFQVTPTSTFDGSVIFSIKVVSSSTANIVYKSSAGTTTNEIRFGTGTNNFFSGIGAGRRNTSGTGNTMITPNGFSYNVTGSNNTGFGGYVLASNSYGSDHSAYGVQSLEKMYKGEGNTAMGVRSLYNLLDGSYNVGIANNAGRWIADGITASTIQNNSVYIGYGTKPLADNQTNQIVVGYNAVGLGSNTSVIGNSSTLTSKIHGITALGYGASVASGTAITATGNLFHVTGTTTITSINGTNLVSGATITIIFDGVLTFTDGSNLKLAGNFTTAADATITLVYDGTNFYETDRSTN